MSRADFDKWEPRYASGRGYGRDPEPWFVDHASAFLPVSGTAVDLAGGSGRHARWLAGRGLQTTLVDISPSALTLATERAQAADTALATLQQDLDQGLPEGDWDVVLISFFLVRDHLAELHRLVRPGGVLLMLHPTAANLQRHDKPGRRWLFDEGEFSGVPGLSTLHLEEGWGESGRHEVRYVGRREG